MVDTGIRRAEARPDLGAPVTIRSEPGCILVDDVTERRT